MNARAYDATALVLQGGGALGSYQCGVVEGLVEAGIEPTWVAGISIGAINAAIVAGNEASRRIERLQGFWNDICRQPGWSGLGWPGLPPELMPEPMQAWSAGLASWRAVIEGQNGFFRPRVAPPMIAGAGTPETASWYDTSALRRTLERHVDFDRINHRAAMRFSVGAVQVRTGNMQYFDNRRQRIGAQHVMASGALPPGFPAVAIDGEPYWDGGLVSNTPLLQVLSDCAQVDRLLVFQVDLWSARGKDPTSVPEVAERQKDIQFSSRTRMVTDLMKRELQHQRDLSALLALVPASRRDAPAARRAATASVPRRCNVMHLIYQAKQQAGQAKDYEFSASTMRAHWAGGLDDVRRTLAHDDWFAVPTDAEPFVTHDVHRRLAG